MARTSTYLNFENQTEKAFEFYKSVFGGEFLDGGINRFRDIPASENSPEMPEDFKDLVMHVGLEITGGHCLMGTDAPTSLGFHLKMGNNVYINLEPDTRSETLRLFNALSAGGKVEHELQEMFWGAYYGSCVDQFGVQWMFNCVESA